MRSTKTTRLLQTSLLIAAIAVAASASASDDAKWIDAQRSKWNIPGVTVAIVQEGKPIRLYASGKCSLEQLPCTVDSPFHIASMTKFFTGLIAASLAADKVVSLDEPLTNAWPAFRLSDARWTEITLRDLLSGRSGLGSIDWPYSWDQSLTREDYLARMKYVPMAEPFRSRWHYANANFVAAGSYLEHVSKKSWETLIQERLLSPLKMNNSGFQLATDKNIGYGLDADGRDIPLPATTTQATGPAASIVSTAKDFATFMQMLLDDGKWRGQPVLATSAIQRATSPVIGVSYDRRFYGPPAAYGFGIYLASYRDNTILHHGGGYPGYTAHFALLPKQKLGVVVLTNRNASLFPEALTLGLIDRALGKSGDAIMTNWFNAQLSAQSTIDAPLVSNSPAAPTHPLNDYQGQYHHPAWGTFTITKIEDQLKIQFGSLETSLEHYRYDSFSFLSAKGWERLRLQFVADFQGNIVGFQLNDDVNAQPQLFTKR